MGADSRSHLEGNMRAMRSDPPDLDTLICFGHNRDVLQVLYVVA